MSREGFIGGALPIGRFAQKQEIRAAGARKGRTSTAGRYVAKSVTAVTSRDLKLDLV